jgi:hypothetical protein
MGRVSGAFDSIIHGAKPSGSNGRGQRGQMLEVPRRGDTIAKRLWWLGVFTYALLAVVLYGSLAATNGGIAKALPSILGLSGGHTNFAVFVLVVAGIVLTISAALFLWKEIGELRAEEIDIEWVLEHKRDGLIFVFEDSTRREALFQSGAHHRDTFSPDVRVETLIDDRVRRTHISGDVGGRTSSEELRILAERRTARWGAAARYVSSLLLLLAVLGTFAGVKTALPPLISAVAQTDGDTMRALQEPLEAVASAFGGNALALIGAIAVGLMAQGIAFGRRNLLERLEMVSSEYIYGDAMANSADPMQAAMEIFKASSKDFKDAAGAMTGIENGLINLGEKFASSFDDLGERLSDISDRNGDEMFDKTARSLASLQSRVGELADAVNANAQVYAGLAPSLQYRAEEAKAALAEMDRTNRQLTVAMEMIGGASRSATELTGQAVVALSHVEKASDRIASASEIAQQSASAFAAVIVKVEPQVSSVDSSLSQIADAVVLNETRLSEMLNAFASRIDKQMSGQQVAIAERFAAASSTIGRSEQLPAAVRANPAGSDDVVRLLKQINEALNDAPKPRIPHPLWFTVGPIVSVMAASTIAYLVLRGR